MPGKWTRDHTAPTPRNVSNSRSVACVTHSYLSSPLGVATGMGLHLPLLPFYYHCQNQPSRTPHYTSVPRTSCLEVQCSPRGLYKLPARPPAKKLRPDRLQHPKVPIPHHVPERPPDLSTLASPTLRGVDVTLDLGVMNACPASQSPSCG